jgi:glucosylceramidase
MNLINQFCRFLFLMVILFSGSSFQGCKKNDNPEPGDGGDTVVTANAHVWLTRGDKTALLAQQGDLTVQQTAYTNWPVITIDTTVTYQSMEGFGAALTGSSAYLLNNKLTAAARLDALDDLFDTVSGIGISYLRLTMGASDFSLSDFTYDDIQAGATDFNLDNFSLSQDLEDVIPVLQDIIKISPDIRLMGTPWSPPAWMKTNSSLKGGKLRTDCYSVYADYFVKYIQAMKDQGITIASVTPQNEPLYYTAGYPCMEMQSGEEAEFIRNHLGPKFESNGINTKIIIYDHNWDNTAYAISILNDAAARQYVAGSAFHAYAGDVSAMGVVHNAHPDKDLYFTEISGGTWATDFASNLIWNVQNIFIGTAKNWSRTAMLWNLALDQNYGPQNGGCNNCRGVITVNSSSKQITKNEEYYAIAHFSKFVRPGAVRVSSIVPSTLNTIVAIAFLNPDGSKALVACNIGSDMKTFAINQGSKNIAYTLPGQSVTTITWE